MGEQHPGRLHDGLSLGGFSAYDERIHLADFCVRILWLGQYYPAFPDTAANAWTYLALAELAKRHQITYFPLYASIINHQSFFDGHGIRLINWPAVSSRSDGNSAGSAISSCLLVAKRLLLPQRLREIVSPASDFLRMSELGNGVQAIDASDFDVLHCDDTKFSIVMDSFPSRPLKTMTVLNVFSSEFRQRADLTTNALKKLWWRGLSAATARRESAAVQRVNLCFAMSEAERTRIENCGGHAQVAPVGVDFDYWRSEVGPASLPGGGPWFMYCGFIQYPPHSDAVQYLIDDIYPLLRRSYPECGLLIVGKSPSPQIRQKSRERVIVTGEVPDVRPYMHAADIMAVPMRFGAGVRIKIMESLCLGKPVIASSVGAEGLGLIAGEHYLRADTPAEFVKAAEVLLNDRAFRERMIESGRLYAQQHFHFLCSTEIMERSWTNLLES